MICTYCFSCKNEIKVKSKVQNTVQMPTTEKKMRHVHDTIGFTKYNWQLDSIYKRLANEDSKNNMLYKAAICPHDDYNKYIIEHEIFISN